MTTISEPQIKCWIYAAQSAVDRAIQAGEAGRAITLLDLIKRLERELAGVAKPANPELFDSKIEEDPVPF